jgi:phosphatidylglycerophosphate synthase
LRTFLEIRGVLFGADWLGKIKMGLQCAALFAIFIVRYVAGGSGTLFLERTRDGLIYAMIAATALSGLQYLWKAAWILKPDRDS